MYTNQAKHKQSKAWFTTANQETDPTFPAAPEVIKTVVTCEINIILKITLKLFQCFLSHVTTSELK